MLALDGADAGAVLACMGGYDAADPYSRRAGLRPANLALPGADDDFWFEGA